MELFLSATSGSQYVDDLLREDLLSDTPFYLQITKEAVLKHYPNTRLLCTKSPRERWITSMIRHGTAGDLLRIMSMTLLAIN